MPYLIQGTSAQLYKSFGLDWLIGSDSCVQHIDDDLYHHRFFGSLEQAKHHINTWSSLSQEQSRFYTTGDMYAGNLFICLNPENPQAPFIKKDEDTDNYRSKIKSIGFAYVSEHNELCALTIFFRHDNLSQWMIGLVKNTHLPPESRTVFLMTSMKLKTTGIANSAVSSAKNKLIEQVDSPFLQSFLQNIINQSSETIDSHCERIEFLLRLIDRNTVLNHEPVAVAELDARSLFVDNPDDNQKVQHVLSKVLHDGAWDEMQSQIIPFLMQRNYSQEQCQFILSDEIYFGAFAYLMQRDLTQHVRAYLTKPDKIAQLEYIHSLMQDSSKHICLVFWAKTEFNLVELKAIADAVEGNPSLADALLALDNTGERSMGELQKIALNPKSSQRLAIIHQFSDQFTDKRKKKLKDLNSAQQLDVANTFLVLRQTNVSSEKLYDLALEHTREGELFRLFIPKLKEIENLSYRSVLIELIDTGMNNRLVSQGKAVNAIEDKALFNLAKEVHERFTCAQQLQNLDFDSQIIAFAAEEKDPKAYRFRQVILKIEEHCGAVDLRMSTLEGKKKEEWLHAVQAYRRMMYEITYEGLHTSQTPASLEVVRNKIKEAEAPVLKIVDPETTFWLQRVLIVLANILITTLTLGYANAYNLKYTGNYYFFTQSKYGAEFRADDRFAFDQIKGPES